MKKVLLILFILFFSSCSQLDLNLENISNENLSESKLIDLQDQIKILNSKYYSQNCNSTVSKDKYNSCLDLYDQISDLTDQHNAILKGELVIEVKEIKKEPILSVKSTPEELDSTLFNKLFNYEFNEKKYNLDLELSLKKYDKYKDYDRAYTYYGDQDPNWQTDYYNMFVNDKEDEKLIKEIIQKIKSNPQIKSEEDLLKAVINFVQTIPYDYESLNKLDLEIHYPYETIFKNKGVCSDVSILLIKLIKELDYEVIGFIFDGANHMAVGIKCPSGYGNFGVDYCFIEATGVTEIGYVPDNYGIYGGITLDTNPNIIRFGGHKTYYGIIADKKEQEKLTQLYGKDYLSMNLEQKELKRKMFESQKKIDSLQLKYDRDCSGTIYTGTSKARTCNSNNDELNDEINYFNELVNKYNNLGILS